MKLFKKKLFAFLLIVAGIISISGCYDALIDILPQEQFIKVRGVVHFGPLSTLDLEVVDAGKSSEPVRIVVFNNSGSQVLTKDVEANKVGAFNIPLVPLAANSDFTIEVQYSLSTGEQIKSSKVSLHTQPFNAILLTNNKVSSSGTNHTFEAKPDFGSISVARVGHVWSTNNVPPNVNVTSNKTNYSVQNNNSFSSNIAIPLTDTYYVWAYATDEINTTYSAAIKVEPVSSNLFTVTTDGVSDLAEFSATVNASFNVSVGTINSYGVVISRTNPYPATNSNEQILSTFNVLGGANSFSKNFTGLVSNTMYYARAFATDGIITKYGAPISFTTGAPTETISLISPAAGSTNFKGNVMTITWNSNFSLPVSIELYKGSVLERVIVSTATNSGSYNWLIPGDVVSGNIYRIKIYKTNDAKVYTFSNDFAIQ